MKTLVYLAAGFGTATGDCIRYTVLTCWSDMATPPA